MGNNHLSKQNMNSLTKLKINKYKNNFESNNYILNTIINTNKIDNIWIYKIEATDYNTFYVGQTKKLKKSFHKTNIHIQN